MVKFNPTGVIKNSFLVLMAAGLVAGPLLLQNQIAFANTTSISNPISGTISGPISTQSLLGYWRFNEGAGNTVSNSGSAGSSINGTLVNGTSFVNGREGKALSFNGTNTANFGSNSAIDNLPLKDFTLSMWINPTNCNSTNYIVGKNNGGNSGFYLISSQGSCNPRMSVFFGSNAGGSVFKAKPNSITANKWQHLTFVWSANSRTAKIYVDGVEVAYDMKIVGTGNYVSDESYNLALGNLHPTTANTTKYQGLVDDLRIYNYAQSQSQIQADLTK